MGDATNFRRALEASRKDLLDLTTRNRLLNTPRRNHRAKAFEIVDELSDEIARILVHEGRVMSFEPATETEDKEEGENATFGDMGQPEEDAVDEHGIAARHSDTKLQTLLSDKQLQKKLLSLFYDARTHEEEQGVNILYLALGFLRWYDSPDSDKVRHAPLILLPARLVRSEVGGRIRLECADDEINTNLSLQAKLHMDFGIGLPDLPDAEELVPSKYFAQVREHVRDQPRWEVLENDIVLSFFSFAKFLMYRDLNPDRWPENKNLAGHDILSRILVDGFEPVPPLWSDEDRVEDHVKPIDQVHVLDADSSQIRAIEEVKRGRSMIIQGPPGTGKSQTIANLIAASVKQGKTVLFVAEKMAALDVVHRRMEDIGLDQLCLELHSSKAKKKEVLLELEKTLRHRTAASTSVALHAKELEEAQRLLNRHVDLLHEVVHPSGITPYRAIGELVRLSRRGFRTSNVELRDAPSWTHASFVQRRDLVASSCQRVQRLGIPMHHPWRGVRLQTVLPSDRARLQDRLARLSEQVCKLEQSVQALASKLERDPAATMTDASQMAVTGAMLGQVPDCDLSHLNTRPWREERRSIRQLLDAGKQHASLREQLKDVLLGSAWDWDPRPTRSVLEEHGRSPFRIFRRAYREARKRLKRAVVQSWKGRLSDQIEALQALEKMQEMGTHIERGESLGVEAFGTEWQGASSPWSKLQALFTWVANTDRELPDVDFLKVLGGGTDPAGLSTLAHRIGSEIHDCHEAFCSEVDFLDLDLSEAFGVERVDDAPLAMLRTRIDEWRQSIDKLQDWIELSVSLRALNEAGLRDIARRLFAGDLSDGTAVDQFSFAYYETVARAAMDQHPYLAAFRGHDHDHVVERFQSLDLRRIKLAREEVAGAHSERLPAGGGIGEMGVLQREFAKKRRHLAIRKLMERACNAIQRIKPVFMMSPVSISHYLAPGDLEFDLLLIDEASQVKPVDAFGAILRSKQVVVVGDDKQLPPTNFFGRSIVDDEEEEEEYGSATDMESILTLCAAKGLPSCMLRWHYRSQHESLIAVSNREFYDNRLYVVPSPHASTRDLGVKFHLVENGVFDRGRSKTNRAEAKRVARAAIEHARAHPNQSLGIGTFSMAQKDAILDELEHLYREEADIRHFFDPGRSDPFFVKNLETIQGDERDVIFISVGYGPDHDGRLHMGFGPLNSEGGERRLNVLISRARMRCEVFSSFRARDMDLSRARGQGVAALKAFLHFAEEGRLDTLPPPPGTHDSPFEEEVHEALHRMGYTVDSQVGMAGFFIDLAVRDPKHPGRYVLGVECDGATYHSSRSARERDRLRQQILESRGWIIHRIWSTDWFQNPEEQIHKTEEAIKKAILTFAQRDRQEKAEQPRPSEDRQGHSSRTDNEDHAPEQPPPLESTDRVQPYLCASPMVPLSSHPELLHVSELAMVVAKIVDTEGPVHEEEVARRVTSLWGLGRTGHRIQSAVAQALLYAGNLGHVIRDGRFYDVARTEPVAIRSRADVASPTLRRPEYLPPTEVRAAILEVIHHHVGANRDDTTRQVARMFGFKSTSAQLAAVIEEQVKQLVAEGMLDESRGILRLVG